MLLPVLLPRNSGLRLHGRTGHNALFLRVGENLVCLVSLLELFLGLFVAGV